MQGLRARKRKVTGHQHRSTSPHEGQKSAQDCRKSLEAGCVKLCNAGLNIMFHQCLHVLMRSALAICACIWVIPLASQALAAEPALSHRSSNPSLSWGLCPLFMPKGCQLAVLRGDPAKPNADVLLRVPVKSVIPNHWHTSAERRVLLDGALQVSCAGQPAVILRPDSYAYESAKAPHKGVCMSSSPCVLFIAFEKLVDAQELP